MFLQVAEPTFAYTDPWRETLYERRRALSSRSRHVAYIYEKPDTSTFRYRVFNMVEAVNSTPGLDVSAAWFTREEIGENVGLIDSADAVVICRTRYDDAVARLIARAHARGARVLFDVDDLIFNPDYVHLITQTIDVGRMSDIHWDVWFSMVARLGATLRLCDAAITTNRFLAQQITAYSPGLPVSCVGNFLNRLQTHVSRKLMARKRASGFRRDNAVHLGYFSGTPTHNRDLLVASPAIATTLARFPSVRLRVVGFIALNEYLEPYSDRVELVPLRDYLNLQRETAMVEIAIAPLQSNIFTNCKSELKYFEAGVVGVPSIASPSFTFARAITDGRNGFLAHSHEWLEQITEAVSLVERDKNAYTEMAERVVADSEERYGWNSQAESIESAVFRRSTAGIG